MTKELADLTLEATQGSFPNLSREDEIVSTDEVVHRRMNYLTHRRRWKMGYDKPYTPVSFEDVLTQRQFRRELAKCLPDGMTQAEIETACQHLAYCIDRGR